MAWHHTLERLLRAVRAHASASTDSFDAQRTPKGSLHPTEPIASSDLAISAARSNDDLTLADQRLPFGSPHAKAYIAARIKALDESEFCRVMRTRLMREFPRRWVTFELHQALGYFGPADVLQWVQPYVATWIHLVRHGVKHFGLITEDANRALQIVHQALPQMQTEHADKYQFAIEDPLDGALSTSDCVFSNAVYLYSKNVSDDDKHDMRRAFDADGFVLYFRDDSYYESRERAGRHDLMISYSHHDQQFVTELSDAISRCGLRVWLDQSAMVPGQYILDEIERATQDSLFVTAILSPEFLANEKWCRFEFRNIMIRQINENRRILIPIWRGVDETMVRRYSPQLSGILALNAAIGVEQLAHQVLQIIEGSRSEGSPF